MNATARNSATIFSRAWKVFGLAAIILFLALPSFSQNTKGDRPEVSGSSGRRESRFKSKKKVKNKQASYNRAQSKGVSRASSARKPPKAGKASQKIYPQRGKFVNNSSKTNDKQRASRRTASGSRVHVRSTTGKTRNVYPQYGRYVNNSSRRPKQVERPVSNKSTLARLHKLQGPEPSGPGKKKKVVPRSASRSFTARKSINVYANFARPKRKGEQAYTKDISGHKLRRKNYETPRVTFTNPTANPYSRRKRVGDQPYKGPSGSYRSATRTTPRAWRGDISGHRIRGRNFSSKRRVEGQPILPSRKNKARYGDRAYRGSMPGGGYKSASQPGEKRTGKSPLPARPPGIGADRIGKYQGNIKGYRPEKGGGSRSGKGWNNRGIPIPVRTPKDGGRAATFQGNVKYNRGFNDQGEEFTGFSKGQRRAPKGAGSVSGRVWNNKQKAIPGRQPASSAMKVGGFPGKIKRYSQTPGFNDQGEEFTGYLKGRKRPLKGAGSVSGKVWNNKQTPVPVRQPSNAARAAGSFPGKIKRYEQSPGFNDQGEEFTGYIKRPWFWKDYVKNENSAEKALKKKRATSATYQTGELQVRVKQREYVKNKNSSEDALLKQKPTKNTQRAGELQVRIKQREYVRNKNSSEEALLKQKPTKNTYRVGDLQVKVREREHGKRPNTPDGALPTLKPSKETVKASQYARGARRNWDYIHNPNSADEALKVREPGKAFARSTDYQGNIKMQKFKFFEKNRQLHPDAQFVKTNKNNVDGERDILTNFKLWWARLFKKEETQPDHLKDKGHKPRYDKGEEGLWYD